MSRVSAEVGEGEEGEREGDHVERDQAHERRGVVGVVVGAEAGHDDRVADGNRHVERASLVPPRPARASPSR